MEFNKNYSLRDSDNNFLDNKLDELFKKNKMGFLLSWALIMDYYKVIQHF